MAKKTPEEHQQPTVDDLKAPLLAAVGAADLALERVNEIVATLRERAGEARTDAEARVEESRARLTKLQEDLPTQFGDLRDRLSSDELRKFAESYAEAAQTTYNKLVERGEVALERLRSQPALEEAAGRVRELHRPGRRADPGGAGQRCLADPRGRRARRQAGRRRAAQEGAEGCGAGQEGTGQEGARQEGSGQEGSGQEGHPEVSRFDARLWAPAKSTRGRDPLG